MYEIKRQSSFGLFPLHLHTSFWPRRELRFFCVFLWRSTHPCAIRVENLSTVLLKLIHECEFAHYMAFFSRGWDALAKLHSLSVIMAFMRCSPTHILVAHIRSTCIAYVRHQSFCCCWLDRGVQVSVCRTKCTLCVVLIWICDLSLHTSSLGHFSP